MLKVQTLKYKSTMEKFLESILCPRNKQSKVAEVTYLSHTPKIPFRALKYYATRPLPEGPKGGASRHLPNPSPIWPPRPLFAHSLIPLPICPPCCPLAHPVGHLPTQSDHLARCRNFGTHCSQRNIEACQNRTPDSETSDPEI